MRWKKETTNPYEIKQVAVELVEKPPLISKEPLNTPEKVVGALADKIYNQREEMLAIINVRGDGRLINMSMNSIGRAEGAISAPKDILKSAILSDAAGIVMLHSYPFGQPKPSLYDIRMTDRMKMTCDLLGIKLLDHIIVNRDKQFYSFRRNDMITAQEISFVTSAESLELDQSIEAGRHTAEMRIQGRASKSMIKRQKEGKLEMSR